MISGVDFTWVACVPSPNAAAASVGGCSSGCGHSDRTAIEGAGLLLRTLATSEDKSEQSELAISKDKSEQSETAKDEIRSQSLDTAEACSAVGASSAWAVSASELPVSPP